MSAEDFIAKLDNDLPKAHEIHRELERLTAAFVKKTLAAMFGRFDENDVTGIVNDTLIIAYTNHAKGKTLDFSNPPKSLQSYFWKIAENLCKKYQRGNYSDKKFDSMSEEDGEGNVRQFASTAKNPEEKLIRREQDKIYRECLIKILNELKNSDPDKHQTLFSYMDSRNKTAQEMKKHREDLAASLEITPTNLTLKINRINEKLRDRLKKCLSAKRF